MRFSAYPINYVNKLTLCLFIDRYMPYQQPHVKMFPVAGVHMLSHETSCGQSRCKVRLTGLTRDHSGGAYRCEVSSDAPAFRLASETHNVTVAALPKVNPVIIGLQDSYQLGDTLAVECRSSAGDPIPELNWYINDVKAPSNIVGDSISSSPKDEGLEHRTVTLRFQIDRKYTQGNFIRLRCVSTVFGIPVSPQTVSQNVVVKAQPTTQVNNEKLHWPDVSSNKPKLQINSSLLCYYYCTVIVYFSFRIKAEL
ncbi:beat protein [Holotrichia oblita]|uniref:Beat protein n=1 Tax=Holotrichia oblita TaxID=644536 RepID=A0ACB9SKY6_HOLOL|nr:beat protein [Holotrichia oblita]